MPKTSKDTSNHWSDEHRYMLYNIAHRVQRMFAWPKLDLDELVNVGWLQAARRTGDLTGISTNTMRCMINHIKEFYLAKPFESIDKYELIYSDEPMDCLDDIILSAANQLSSPAHRQVFTSYYLHGMPMATIAKQLSISRETVRLWLNNALETIHLSEDNLWTK